MRPGEAITKGDQVAASKASGELGLGKVTSINQEKQTANVRFSKSGKLKQSVPLAALTKWSPPLKSEEANKLAERKSTKKKDSPKLPLSIQASLTPKRSER